MKEPRRFRRPENWNIYPPELKAKEYKRQGFNKEAREVLYKQSNKRASKAQELARRQNAETLAKATIAEKECNADPAYAERLAQDYARRKNAETINGTKFSLENPIPKPYEYNAAPKPHERSVAPASPKSNLTFNSMLKDLGLTGKESADTATLKKVQAWLNAHPGYIPGTRTNTYIKQLASQPEKKVQSVPTESVKTKPVQTKPTPKKPVTGTELKYELEQIKNNSTYRNMSLNDFIRFVASGQGNFYNTVVGKAKQVVCDGNLKEIIKICSFGR